jgi:O-antigen/teichoic acid export membrane protein
MSSLRRAVYRGGGYLAFRQGVGLVLSIGGVLLLTRLLGPAQYGLYAAALTLQLFAQILAGWGVGTYLVRRSGEDREEDYHHAFSFLLVAGLAAVAVTVLSLPLIERFSRLELGLPALVLFLAIPVQLATAVPMARIERALDFRSVARVELAGQAAFVLVSVGLAAAGFGVWAPVIGYWVQQVTHAVGYFAAAGYRPRWAWSAAANRAMLGFGSGYSTSLCVWQARRLVNPLIVGRYLGSEAVGYVAVATQIASQLAFVVGAAWRLSTAALARLQHDRQRTANAITEGMYLQALAVGPPLVAFGWIGSWLVPQVFGESWAPLMQVYPAVALALLTSSVFLLQSSALYVRHRTWEVTWFHVANVALLAGTAAALLPRIGLAGYAYAEVAAILSYAVLHVFVRMHVAKLSYAAPAAAWLAFATALALPGQPLIGVALLSGVLLLKPTRLLVAGMWRELWGHAYDG